MLLTVHLVARRKLNHDEIVVMCMFIVSVPGLASQWILWWFTPWREQSYRQHQDRIPIDEEVGRAGLESDRESAREAAVRLGAAVTENSGANIGDELLPQPQGPAHQDLPPRGSIPVERLDRTP
jgi:hypothetical protein